MEEGPCTNEERTQDQKLQLLLKNLEHEWDFIKQKPEKTLYRTSSGSSKMTKTLGYLNENSPRKLMSALQQKTICSPLMDDEEVTWKVRTNDLAVEEILRERRAAIESGKLKGRRLFEEVEDHEVRSVFSYESDNDNNNNYYEDEINWPRKQHLSPSYPHCSCSCSCSLPSSSSSSLCGPENLQSRSGTEVAIMAEKKIGYEYDVGSGRVGLNIIKVWIVAISLIVLIVGFISMRSFGIFEDEEVILTPT